VDEMCRKERKIVRMKEAERSKLTEITFVERLTMGSTTHPNGGGGGGGHITYVANRLKYRR